MRSCQNLPPAGGFKSAVNGVFGAARSPRSADLTSTLTRDTPPEHEKTPLRFPQARAKEKRSEGVSGDSDRQHDDAEPEPETDDKAGHPPAVERRAPIVSVLGDKLSQGTRKRIGEWFDGEKRLARCVSPISGAWTETRLIHSELLHAVRNH